MEDSAKDEATDVGVEGVGVTLMLRSGSSYESGSSVVIILRFLSDIGEGDGDGEGEGYCVDFLLLAITDVLLAVMDRGRFGT